MARLADLERSVPFSRRHIGPSPEDQERMLALLGHASLDDLARAAVPSSILLGSDLDLPEALPEIDVLAELRELGHRNRVDDHDDRTRLLRHPHASGRAA